MLQITILGACVFAVRAEKLLYSKFTLILGNFESNLLIENIHEKKSKTVTPFLLSATLPPRTIQLSYLDIPLFCCCCCCCWLWWFPGKAFSVWCHMGTIWRDAHCFNDDSDGMYSTQKCQSIHT